jgi:hypothetical protein
VKVLTGSNLKIGIGKNGQFLTYAGGTISWSYLSEFDIKFSSKYAIKADNMAHRFDAEAERASKGYRHITELCELLWKLQIIKL